MEGDLDVPETREFLLPLDRTTISDLGAPGRIVGRVLEGGRDFGVADVDITVMTPAPVSTLSDSNGNFSLTDVDTGLVEVRFERLGYLARTATVIVQPDRTLEIAATMSAQPIELDPIEVVVRSRALEQNGFYRRANTTWGSQLTRKDLDEIQPIFVSDIFRRLPGVRVEAGAIIGRRTAFGDRCELRLFLDGLPMGESILLTADTTADADALATPSAFFEFDNIPTDYLEAVEVYQGLGTPIQYGPACGVVLLWTRSSGR
jgi:hypothetical protein